MLNAKQIEHIIRDEHRAHNGADRFIETAAEKIIAALPDYNQIAVTAAALENEVTSTLMDMTVATVLATLIEEEGGGRSNIGISPLSMDHMMKHYLYEVRNEGMIRHVSIKLREDSNLQDEAAWREPSNRHGLVDVAPDSLTIDQLKPQAEPKEYNRPIWAVHKDGALLRMNDRADAERQAREMVQRHDKASIEEKGHFEPSGITIQNRWCLHLDCPSSGCNHDPKLRDD